MLAQSLKHEEVEMISEKATSIASCTLMREREMDAASHGYVGWDFGGLVGLFAFLCSEVLRIHFTMTHHLGLPDSDLLESLYWPNSFSDAVHASSFLLVSPTSDFA